jgi:hypothetical protein
MYQYNVLFAQNHPLRCTNKKTHSRELRLNWSFVELPPSAAPAIYAAESNNKEWWGIFLFATLRKFKIMAFQLVIPPLDVSLATAILTTLFASVYSYFEVWETYMLNIDSIS